MFAYIQAFVIIFYEWTFFQKNRNGSEYFWKNAFQVVLRG